MKRTLVTLAFVLLSGTPALAANVSNYMALLNAGQEVPVGGSTAFGVSFLTYDKTTMMLCQSTSFSPLVGGLAAMHIHGPAAVGVNAPVLFPVSATNPSTGCVGPLTSDDAKNLKKSLLYLNVHTTVFPGGEIRGQIVPAAK